MRLLFVTQVLDMNDSVLGAYHGWVRALAERTDSVIVVCLFEGEHALPDNVTIFSLGKEKGKKPAFVYTLRFFKLAWRLRKEYDTVFVHMNQEYLLLAGVLWKFLGKKMYLWRNHYSGTWLTDVAVAFCTKVFCTSRYSYTAKFKKTVLMPVGVDLERFETGGDEVQVPGSILFFSRISPSKRVDAFIEALGMLVKRGVVFRASVYGSPTPKDETYYTNVKAQAQALGLSGCTKFFSGIPNTQAPGVFRSHDIYVNCSTSGMFDKVLFEAAASGCVVVAQSKDWGQLLGKDSIFSGTAEDLAQHLQDILIQPKEAQTVYIQKQKEAARSNSLYRLATELVKELS